MKRIVPYVLILASATFAYACSSSKSSNDTGAGPDEMQPTPGEGEDGGAPTADGGGSSSGGDSGSQVQPATDDPTGSPIMLGTPHMVRNFSAGGGGGGEQFVDGPVWSPTRSALFVALPLAQSTLGGGGKGVLTTFKADGTNYLEVRAGDAATTGVFGNTIDKAGNLVSAELKIITRTPVTPSGPMGAPSVVATGVGGATPADPVTPFNGPKDLVVRDDGTIYVTDPGYNVNPRPANGFLYKIAPAATSATIIDTYGDNPSPNGIAFSKDQKSLFVSFTAPGEGALPFIRKYAVSADGAVQNAGKFCELPMGSEPTGIAVDDSDNLVVATNIGLAVFKATGEPYGGASAVPQVKMTSAASNVAFGGADRKSVFVTTADGKVLEYKTKIPGLLQ